jgi:hypothetical protein
MTRFESKLSALALGAGLLLTSLPAWASETFPLYYGVWEGEGTIAWKSDGSKERMRCTATYGAGNAVDKLALKYDCKSDNYTISLDGTFEQDSKGNIKGQWSERSRNIGGTAIGQAKAERMRLRIESSAFGANLLMGVKADKQQLVIHSSGAGEEADIDIALKKTK